MRGLFPLIIILQISLTADSQAKTVLPDSIRIYLDTLISLNKTHSIYQASVNWDTLRTLAYQKAYGAKTVKDLVTAIQFIYSELGDNHGHFDYKEERIGIPYKQRDISPYFIRKIFGDHVGLQSSLLQKKYGYILIPSLNTDDSTGVNIWAQRIKDSLCSVSSPGVRGWIIDLRFNQGGNIFAMLGGLAGIIGDGVAGSLTNADGNTTDTWNIKNESFYLNGKLLTNTKGTCVLHPALPIVGLISEMTASAGEGVAVVLKGRPNSLLLGRGTWGVSTGLMGFKIDENCIVMVTQSYMTDRKGNIYKNGVSPDVEIIGGDNTEQLLSDKKIIEAIKWLDKWNNR